MKLKAVKDFQGSLNGYEVITIEKGTVLDVDEATAKIFLAAGYCEPASKEKAAQQNAD